MKVQFILYEKSQSKLNNSQELLQDMFSKIFTYVSDDSFLVTMGTKTHNINYTSMVTKKEMIHLTFYSNSKPSDDAKFLSQAKNLLLCGQHRKDFYIINTYDEASAYYCEKLAPRIGRFERLTRNLIYITLTQSLGKDWFGKSFTTGIKNELKGKNHNLIEQGLEEMTFNQLYSFLFDEFPDRSAEEAIYQDLLGCDNLHSKSKEDIISIINSCKKQCLWERYFKDKPLDFKDTLDNIRIHRNNVAHNKTITFSEYSSCLKKLQIINTKLEKLIENENSELYSEVNIVAAITSFMALFSEMASEAQKNLLALRDTIDKIVVPLKKAMPEIIKLSQITTQSIKSFYGSNNFLLENEDES